jgi:hypothetical protein
LSRFEVGKRVPTRNVLWVLKCINVVEVEAEMKGRSHREWETAVTGDDVDVVIIDGCWPLPERGR